jgi:hypothetical protein
MWCVVSGLPMASMLHKWCDCLDLELALQMRPVLVESSLAAPCLDFPRCYCKRRDINEYDFLHLLVLRRIETKKALKPRENYNGFHGNNVHERTLEMLRPS